MLDLYDKYLYLDEEGNKHNYHEFVADLRTYQPESIARIQVVQIEHSVLSCENDRDSELGDFDSAACRIVEELPSLKSLVLYLPCTFLNL